MNGAAHARIFLFTAGFMAAGWLTGFGMEPTRSHDVRMNSNSFAPSEIIARAGDTLRFVNGNGGPHNVQFNSDSVAPAALRLLDAAMPGGKIGTAAGPLLIDPDEVYQFAVPALAPGRYQFFCLPHWSSGMTGVLVVKP